jgi:hypothetical protein
MKKLLPILLILFISCGGQSSTSENNVSEKNPPPVSENGSMTSKLKKDVQEGFNMTSWYRHIKNISVKGSTIEVVTNLTTADKSAQTICGAISGNYYMYDNSTQNETLKLYGQNNKLLLERNGISNQCR